MDHFLAYLDKKWEIYEIFQNKMFYSDEEPGGRDLATHSKHSLVEQVSHPCEDKWEIYEIDHEIIPYFEYGSTFDGKEDLGKGFSPSDKFDHEDIEIDDNYCNTPTCFQRTIFPRLECNTSCHEMDYIEDVESLKDYFHHMDEEFFTKYQILKNLE